MQATGCADAQTPTCMNFSISLSKLPSGLLPSRSAYMQSIVSSRTPKLADCAWISRREQVQNIIMERIHAVPPDYSLRMHASSSASGYRSVAVQFALDDI